MAITNPLDMVNGILALVSLIIIIILGLKLILKYFKYKANSLLFMGISLIGLGSRTWPKILAFFFALFSEITIPFEIYFIIGFGHGIGLIFWMLCWISMTEMKEKNKKSILIIYFSFEALYFSVFYFTMFTNPSAIGTYIPLFEEEIGTLIRLHNLVLLILLGSTAIIFFFGPRKSKNKEVRLKGIFFLFGTILLFVTWLLDFLLRIELVLSVGTLLALFLYYIGFTFPKWVKNLFLKSE